MRFRGGPVSISLQVWVAPGSVSFTRPDDKVVPPTPRVIPEKLAGLTLEVMQISQWSVGLLTWPKSLSAVPSLLNVYSVER
jgi:hypothetical protein